MFISTLTTNNQLTLLYDLLDEQQIYGTITTNEYRQIKNLVRTITTNKHINDKDLQFILPEIYYYSIKGEFAHSFRDHIEMNKENIKKWLKTIQKTKQNIS